MPRQTFILNGKTVTVDVADDVRLLWVLRDRLGVTGPKYGCGINVCKACTSHINGKAFNPCAVPVGRRRSPTTRSPPSRACPAGREEERASGLHPMQEAWLDRDVAQCGYCQPGQIMAAVALVRQVARGGPRDHRGRPRRIRNICRCGTYTRIREAIVDGAERM